MRRILQYSQEVKAEFKNIAWPKKEALIQLTFVVISISIILSLLLGGMDFIFTQAINLLGQPNNKPIQPIVTPIVTVSPINKVTPTIIIKPTIKNAK